MPTLLQNRMATKSAGGNAARAKAWAGSKRACAQRAGKAAHQAKQTQGNPRKRVLHSCIAGCLSLQMQFCVMFAGHERVFIFIFTNIIRYSSNIVLLFAVEFSTIWASSKQIRHHCTDTNGEGTGGKRFLNLELRLTIFAWCSSLRKTL